MKAAECADDLAELRQLLYQVAEPEKVESARVFQNTPSEIPSAAEHLTEVSENIGDLGPRAGAFAPGRHDLTVSVQIPARHISLGGLP